MKVEICNCNPGISHQVTSTDVKLLRRVRKDSIQTADRWEKDGEDRRQVVCARYTAQRCLERLRELNLVH